MLNPCAGEGLGSHRRSLDSIRVDVAVEGDAVCGAKAVRDFLGLSFHREKGRGADRHEGFCETVEFGSLRTPRSNLEGDRTPSNADDEQDDEKAADAPRERESSR